MTTWRIGEPEPLPKSRQSENSPKSRSSDGDLSSLSKTSGLCGYSGHSWQTTKYDQITRTFMDLMQYWAFIFFLILTKGVRKRVGKEERSSHLDQKLETFTSWETFMVIKAEMISKIKNTIDSAGKNSKSPTKAQTLILSSNSTTFHWYFEASKRSYINNHNWFSTFTKAGCKRSSHGTVDLDKTNKTTKIVYL